MFAHLGVIGNLGIIEATMKIPKDAKAQIEQILGRFIRQIPSKPEYQTRLVEELEIIIINENSYAVYSVDTVLYRYYIRYKQLHLRRLRWIRLI